MRPTPLLLLAVVLNAHAGERFGGSVGVTSDYRLQGLSYSNGNPAAQAELHYQSRADQGATWFGGLWASTVKLDDQTESSVQLEAFVGRQWTMGSDWQGKATLAHYAHPWSTFWQHYDYDELTLEAGYRDTVRFTASYSPNTDLSSRYYGLRENRRALAFEATAGVPVRGSFAASAGVGYRDVRSFFGRGYWYGSVGLAYDKDRLHASLFRVQTDRVARRLFYADSAAPAWVGTFLWSF